MENFFVLVKKKFEENKQSNNMLKLKKGIF